MASTGSPAQQPASALLARDMQGEPSGYPDLELASTGSPIGTRDRTAAGWLRERTR
jgi:hypothetical protein